jgi:hypothetical protein
MTAVPAQYQSYVTAAARATGLPEAVVATQINVESSFNPNAVSPAGAEGIAQFEPATFASYGSGSPFNVADAFAAYTKYMSALLKQEGGDIRKALEAYNAGPGNLGAGAGYADLILKDAGTGDTTVSSPGSKAAPGTGANSGGGLLSWPTEITGFFSKGIDNMTSVGAWFTAFTKPTTYVRIGSGFIGTVFIILGIVCLARETRNS